MIDFITTVLFESMPWLLFFCCAAVAIALAVHRRRMTPGSRKGIYITLGACVGLLLLQRFVVTERESLTSVLQAMARAVDEGEVPALLEHVSPEFKWRSAGRQEFLDDVTQRLIATQIDGARITQVKANVADDSALVSFLAVCDIRDRQFDQRSVTSYWELRFVRRDGRWLMEAILKGEIRPGGLAPSGGIDVVPMIR